MISRVRLRDRLPRVAYAGDVQASAIGRPGGVVDPTTFPIASPWSTADLQRIVAEDIFGGEPCNTRAAAMRIPAIARGRKLLVTAGARAVMRALRGVDQAAIAPAPSWLTATGDGTSPQHRMVWTVDDLLFYGWSLWWRNNGSDGFPLTSSRINQGEWRVNGDYRIEIRGQVVPDENVTLIPAYDGGILDHGRDAISDAKALLRNVRARIKTPLPGVDLHQTGGTALTKEERDDLISVWVSARGGENAGVGFTSKDIVANPLASDDDGRLMIESRNAMAVDMARVLGIGAGLIDATAPKASLNYETTELRNQEFIDRDLAGYLDPIAARLSMDDVSPHGTRIAFDLSDMQTPTPAPTGPAQED